MHSHRGTDPYPGYGAHDPWMQPCNGFWLEDFDFTADPLEYEGRHREPPQEDQ